MLRTTAIDLARERGWSLADLARKSGLSIRQIHYLADGRRGCGPETIQRLMRTFPGVSFKRLFVPVDSTNVQTSDTPEEKLVA
jgi:transcriptional regulator with XRE-family HTH domain